MSGKLTSSTTSSAAVTLPRPRARWQPRSPEPRARFNDQPVGKRGRSTSALPRRLEIVRQRPQQLAGARKIDLARGVKLIILGIILLIIGFIAHIAIIWTIGIIVLVIGVILALLGMTGHAVRGRRHYFLARRSQLAMLRSRAGRHPGPLVTPRAGKPDIQARRSTRCATSSSPRWPARR